MIRPTDLRFELPDGRPVPDRLFSDVDVSVATEPETHEVAIRNHHREQTLHEARVWCEALDAPMSLSVDGMAFWPARNETMALSVGDLGPGEARLFWIRRDVGGPAAPQTVWLRISGAAEDI